MYNSYTEVTISHKIVKQNLKNMVVMQPHPTHILYQCAKFGDDRVSFNVIFWRVRRLTCKRPIFRYFWGQKCVPCLSIVIFESP